MKRAALCIAGQARQMEVFDSIVVVDESALTGEELHPWKHLFRLLVLETVFDREDVAQPAARGCAALL